MSSVSVAAFGAKQTPYQCLLDALEQADGIEFVVVTWKNKDGFIATGWSSSTDTEKLGMLEVAKTQIINGMFEPE